MSVFGSEQIQTATLKSRFFDYYLLVVNIGGIVSTIVIRTIYNNSHASHSPYFIPSIIAASAIWISAILFVIGWKYYFHDNLRETVVINCIPVIINAFQARRRYERESSKVQSQQIASEPSTTLNASQSSSDDGHRRIPIDNRPAKFLDFAKVPYGKFHDRIVNDVKSLQGIMLVFTLLIPYWVIWSQVKITHKKINVVLISCSLVEFSFSFTSFTYEKCNGYKYCFYVAGRSCYSYK